MPGGGGEIAQGHFTADGARLLVHRGRTLTGNSVNWSQSLLSPSTVEVWTLEPELRKLISRPTVIHPPWDPSLGLCIDAAGTRLVTLDERDSQLFLQAWNVDTGEALGPEREVGLRDEARVAVSPDGTTYASFFHDRAFEVTDPVISTPQVGELVSDQGVELSG